MFKIVIAFLLLMPVAAYGLTHDDKLQPKNGKFQITDLSINPGKCCIIMGLVKNIDNVTYSNITIDVTVFEAKSGSIKYYGSSDIDSLNGFSNHTIPFKIVIPNYPHKSTSDHYIVAVT